MNLLAIPFIIVIVLAVIAGVCMFLAPVPQFKWFVPPVQKPAQEPISLFCEMEVTIGNMVYRTAGATILAVEKGKSFGLPTEKYLMKTPNGNYFRQIHQDSLAQDNYLWTCTKEDAMSYYNHMPDKRVSFFEAFGEELIDA